MDINEGMTQDDEISVAERAMGPYYLVVVDRELGERTV